MQDLSFNVVLTIEAKLSLLTNAYSPLKKLKKHLLSSKFHALNLAMA